MMDAVEGAGREFLVFGFGPGSQSLSALASLTESKPHAGMQHALAAIPLRARRESQTASALAV